MLDQKWGYGGHGLCQRECKLRLWRREGEEALPGVRRQRRRLHRQVIILHTPNTYNCNQTNFAATTCWRSVASWVWRTPWTNWCCNSVLMLREGFPTNSSYKGGSRWGPKSTHWSTRSQITPATIAKVFSCSVNDTFKCGSFQKSVR